MTKLNKEAGMVSSVKFNLRKKELNNKLYMILSEKREIRDLEIREKYQASCNDSTKLFYQAILDMMS